MQELCKRVTHEVVDAYLVNTRVTHIGAKRDDSQAYCVYREVKRAIADGLYVSGKYAIKPISKQGKVDVSVIVDTVNVFLVRVRLRAMDKETFVTLHGEQPGEYLAMIYGQLAEIYLSNQNTGLYYDRPLKNIPSEKLSNYVIGAKCALDDKHGHLDDEDIAADMCYSELHNALAEIQKSCLVRQRILLQGTRNTVIDANFELTTNEDGLLVMSYRGEVVISPTIDDVYRILDKELRALL